MKESKHIDFELVKKVQDGETSAFATLVDKYKGVSFSLACSILKHEQEAEDALQDSFIKAYKGLGRFRFQSAFSSWLYKIVVNTCYNKYNRTKKMWSLDNLNDEVPINCASDLSASDNLLEEEKKIMVNAVLNILTPNEALLLRLYYLAEMNIAEIKEVTGFGESKIKVSLHRARNSFLLKYQQLFKHETNNFYE